jgi:hypothetical protein
LKNFEENNCSLGPLDYEISSDEVMSELKNLKTGNACGPNYILNEMLKHGETQLLPSMCKLFYFILNSGNFVTIWANDYLTVLHKKGNKHDPNNVYYINGFKIDVVDCYTYLGTKFHKSGNFSVTCIDMCSKARKAIFKVRHELPISLSHDVNLSMKYCMILYGCEIWGFQSLKLQNCVDKLHLKLCKEVLGVSKFATNAGVLGELGRHPIKTIFLPRIHSFRVLPVLAETVHSLVHSLTSFIAIAVQQLSLATLRQPLQLHSHGPSSQL